MSEAEEHGWLKYHEEEQILIRACHGYALLALDSAGPRLSLLSRRFSNRQKDAAGGARQQDTVEEDVLW